MMGGMNDGFDLLMLYNERKHETISINVVESLARRAVWKNTVKLEDAKEDLVKLNDDKAELQIRIDELKQRAD